MRLNSLAEIHDNNILVDKREIFLYSVDSSDKESSEINMNTAMTFLKNLRYLESLSLDPIIIHNSSYGGEWDVGMAIYDSIAASKCHITMICHGTVQSIATVILQATDDRQSMPNCKFMFHDGCTGIHPDLTHRQMKSYSICEQQNENVLYDIYTDKCIDGPFFTENNRKRSEVKAYIKTQIGKKEDWLLNAEEALNYGFIDKIIGNTKK